MLNREADMLEWKLLLVDGAHWNGIKKLQKPDLESTDILGEHLFSTRLIHSTVLYCCYRGVVMGITLSSTNPIYRPSQTRKEENSCILLLRYAQIV